MALEGAISKRAAMNSLAQGNLPQVPPVHGPFVGLGSLPLIHAVGIMAVQELWSVPVTLSGDLFL